MSIQFDNWTKATENLPWGVQQVMYDTLQAVADGQVKLVWGANYFEGSPCLVNAVANMTGKKNPTSDFPFLVSAFDEINRFLLTECVNDDNLVSPLAAEILIRNFGRLKDKPLSAQVNEALETPVFSAAVYKEPSDEELTRDWLNALNVEGPECERREAPSNSTVS